MRAAPNGEAPSISGGDGMGTTTTTPTPTATGEVESQREVTIHAVPFSTPNPPRTIHGHVREVASTSEEGRRASGTGIVSEEPFRTPSTSHGSNNTTWGRDAQIQLEFRNQSMLEDLKLQQMDDEASIPESQRSYRFEGGDTTVALVTDVHVVTVTELEARFQSNRKEGLTTQRAGQLLHEYGRNVLTPAKQIPVVLKFFLYLFEGFGPLLWVGAILCFIAYYPLSYKTPDGVYNLALSICLIFVIFISGGNLSHATINHPRHSVPSQLSPSILRSLLFIPSPQVSSVFGRNGDRPSLWSNSPR